MTAFFVITLLISIDTNSPSLTVCVLHCYVLRLVVRTTYLVPDFFGVLYKNGRRLAHAGNPMKLVRTGFMRFVYATFLVFATY